MGKIYLALLVSLCASEALAEAVGFDQDPVGAPPLGWVCGVTGRGLT